LHSEHEIVFKANVVKMRQIGHKDVYLMVLLFIE